jgi:hypothetical protein
MDSIKPFKGQNYEELKQSHNSANLFEDPLFKVTKNSLSSLRLSSSVTWRRPKVNLI